MFKPIKAMYYGSKGKIIEFALAPDDNTNADRGAMAVFVSEDGRIYCDSIQFFRVVDPGMVPIKYRKGLEDDPNKQAKPTT